MSIGVTAVPEPERSCCWLLAAPESWLYASLLNSAFSDIPLVAWSWPWWEYSYHGNWQSVQTRASSANKWFFKNPFVSTALLDTLNNNHWNNRQLSFMLCFYILDALQTSSQNLCSYLWDGIYWLEKGHKTSTCQSQNQNQLWTESSWFYPLCFTASFSRRLFQSPTLAFFVMPSCLHLREWD